MAQSDPPRQSASLTVEQAFAHAIAHHKAGRLQDAERLYRAILSVQPEDADAHHNLGLLMMQPAAEALAAGRYADAEALLDGQLAQFSGDSFFWKLRGSIYSRTGRHAEALASLQQATGHLPPDAEVHTNLASIFNNLGQPDDALSSCRSALEISPDSHLATWNIAIARLAQGRYSEGWPCYEIRSALKENKIVVVPDLPFPCWRGESLDGKSLLLWPEQGAGDYVQFIRYASLLKARGVSRLTVRCPAALRDLLATAAGVDEVITDSDPVPQHDYWSFPLSLPLHFGTTLESIPEAPYLHSLPERRDHWRNRLPLGGFKVGLVWKGSSAHSNDAHRSLPSLDALRPLWRIPSVTFVSLQKGAGEDDVGASGLPIAHLGSDIRDFADTAAIIDQLDLVICVDTAIAHVAGALGKPCWVLLPAIGCDWRWLQDRSDSPWYPHVLRLFRQKEQGDWSNVIDEVAIALRDRMG